MAIKHLKPYLLLCIITALVGCSKNVQFSQEFKDETSGKYLYNADDIIEVYYKENQPYLKWRGGAMEPVVIDYNSFFVADMYEKLRFVKHPNTGKRYLSIIPKVNPDSIRYDYLKVSDDYITPSSYLKQGNYEKALEGFLEIKKQDSTSSFINERDFNSKGYRAIRDADYEKAIAIFKLNVALHPTSDNVYDSLGQAYLMKGDSTQAYINYKKSFEINPRNERAGILLEKLSKAAPEPTETTN